MDTGSANYCETRVNGVSPHIVLADQGSASVSPLDVPAFDVGGPVALTLGNDGLAAPSYVGTISGATRTGLQALAPVEALDLNLLAVPGISTEVVVKEIIDICETRADCFGLPDHPMGLNAQEWVEWSNGTGAHGTTSAINSSYVGLFFNWVEVADQYGALPGSTIWLPPSCFAAQRIAHTDNVAEVWISPAGMQRGRIPHAIDVEVAVTQGEIEHMYGYPNICNPIAKFRTDGIVLWGNRTAQRMPSATDRINVRRMMLYARKVVASAVKYMTFEPNDPQTWRQFERLVNPFLRDIKDKRGLYEFYVQMDDTTNTPYLIDNNVMNGRVFMKPTKTAEVIEIDFVLTSTGAKFEELLGTSL